VSLIGSMNPNVLKSMKLPSLILLIAALGLAIAPSTPLAAQSTPFAPQTPSGVDRRSQPARVVQRLGTTEVAIAYNRPVARGRDLFGSLVPWDSIWNPGADEATRIEVNEDITISGQRLAAGRYSIWAIPTPGEWILIFNDAWDVQHRPYREGNEVMRIPVTPARGSHMESLSFYFPLAEADSAILALHWGETVLSLPIRTR